MPSIEVILPALDEAAAILSVLVALPPGYVPLVVDNGSSDATAKLARSFGARVVSEPVRGFGAAAHAGLLAARSELVCFMDCDGSFDPSQLPRVADPVSAGEADLVLGRRIPEPGSWPLHARAANAVLALALRRRIGVSLHDLGPMRAARRQALLDLGLLDRAFGYPLEMVIRAAARGWRIEERPIDYRPRLGRSKVTGTVRGTARAVRDMSRLLADPPS